MFIMHESQMFLKQCAFKSRYLLVYNYCNHPMISTLSFEA